jgi:hypothetical protein
VNDLEELMRELVRSSILLKRKLYRRDEAASTSTEETAGPRIEVHSCRLCDRAAAGKEAQVHHRSGCELERLQRAQKALREAWPAVFTKKSSTEERTEAPSACAHSSGAPIP